MTTIREIEQFQREAVGVVKRICQEAMTRQRVKKKAEKGGVAFVGIKEGDELDQWKLLEKFLIEIKKIDNKPIEGDGYYG